MNLNWHKRLNEEERRLIFGNEYEDSLTKGYDKKNVSCTPVQQARLLNLKI